MKKLKSIIYFILVTNIFFCSVAASAEKIGDKKMSVRIAAGSLLEGHYFIGLRLCRYITESNNGINCEVVPTSGSLESILLLHDKKVDFAFSLENLALDAYRGKGYFVDSDPFDDMLQVLKLHDKALTVIAKDKDKILLFRDLDGKKISNGPKNSDSTIAYFSLSSYYDFENQPIDVEMNHEDYANSFCKGEIDAIILMAGHPSALVNYITHACDSDFVSIEKDKINMLLQDNVAFKKHMINKGGYPGIDRSEETVAIPIILLTNKSISPQLITNFMSYLKPRIEQFKLSDPLLYDLEKGNFTSNFVLPSAYLDN